MDDSVPLLRRPRLQHQKFCTRTVVIALVWLLFALFSPLPAWAQHCDIEAGSPSCELITDVGSNNQRSMPGHHVGNPIDVITGNKYQVEHDYQAVGSPLSFRRHYNTALVEHNNRLGHGWRHSYHVVLSKITDNQYQIVQSDGRRILFSRTAGENDRIVFKSPQDIDGEIVQADQFMWHLPDGRVLTFHGSFLVRIDFNDDAQNYLNLYYEQRKLRSITDQFDRTLTLQYTAGSIGLDHYDVNSAQAMPGHLESIILPSGRTIEYSFDGNKNLSVAQYSENDTHTYEYSNTELPHHLTKRSQKLTTDSDKTNIKSWGYDSYGRANLYRSNNERTDLDIAYRDETSTTNNGIADVFYVSSGAVRSYTWQLDEVTTSRRVTSISDRLCADCDEITYLPSQTIDSSQADSTAQSENQGTQPPGQANQQNKPATNPAQPILIRSDGSTDTFLMPSGEKIDITANRSGDILNIANDQTDVRTALEELATGNTQCTGGSADDCRNTIESLIEQADEIRRTSQNTGGISTRSVNNGPGCSLPAGRSCSELERDYEMAVLSACVYHSGPCSSSWQAVNPTSVGLTQSDFEDGDGFYARLYQHPVTGEYVLAFRGTLEGEDWVDNLHQMHGRATSQYLRAQSLSTALAQNIQSGSNLSYTGHSLGGGLATVAALNTSNYATVFNSAALHPETANQLGIPYNNANQYVDNLTVEGEIITWIQDYPPTEPPPYANADEIENHPDQVYYPAPGERFPLPPTSSNLSSIDRHLTPAVINSIRMILQNACGIFP